MGDGEPFSHDGEMYDTTCDKAEEFDSLGILPDGSGTATHLATDGETWKCRDRIHLLFNHIATPFFFREDFTDPNKEHTADGAGYNVLWGEWGSYPYCTLYDPCPPRFNLTEHRDRPGSVTSDWKENTGLSAPVWTRLSPNGP